MGLWGVGVGVVAALVGLAGEGGPGRMTDAELARSVARLIAIPRTGGKVTHIGTGFVFDADGSGRTLLTTAHLVKDAAGVCVDFPGGQRFHAVTAWIDTRHDLAVVKLNAAVPRGATALRAYDGPDPTRVDGGGPLRDGLRVAGYLQGHPAITLRAARFESVVKAHEIRADGKASEDCLDAEVRVYQLEVNFTDGGSGSPVVDRAGRVLGVYQGGPLHGTAALNFCVPYVHLAGVARREVPVRVSEMTFVGEQVAQMADYLLAGLIRSDPQGLPGELPTQVILPVAHEAIFRDFLGNVNGQALREIRQGIDAILDNGRRKVNHVVDTRVGVGFLVPAEFVLKQGHDPESEASWLTVRRRGSDYSVRFYARPIALPEKDTNSEKDAFRREALKFLSRVLEVQATPPGVPATERGQAAVGPTPFSWTWAYRDSFAADLVSFRTYMENGQGLLHAYSFELCRRTSRSNISGLSAPVAAFTEEKPSKDLLELFFILSSAYDTDLGLERTKVLRKAPGHRLTRNFELPTPPPAEAPPQGMPAVKLFSPFPPAPDDNEAAKLAEGNGGERPEPTGPAPAPVPVPPPPQVYTASNLGITFHMVRFPDGRLGARLNDLPVPGSPAWQVWIGPIVAPLGPGATILALDDIPIRGPNSLMEHVGRTSIDFIGGRSGQLMRGFTFIPGPGPMPMPGPGLPGFPPGPGPAPGPGFP